MSPPRSINPKEAVLALLAARAPGATVCPSEAARLVAADRPATDWRDAMPEVHAAIDELLAAGAIRLSWKGQPLAERAGPYRIARSDGGADRRRRIVTPEV